MTENETGKPHSGVAAVIQMRKGVGLGQMCGRSMQKKASKDVKKEGSSEKSTSPGKGHKREEELGGSQTLGELGGAADLQEERYEVLYFVHVLFAVPLEHPCGHD